MGSKQWELTQLDLCTVSISFTLATPLMCQLQLCGDLSLTLTDVCKLGPFFLFGFLVLLLQWMLSDVL